MQYLWDEANLAHIYARAGEIHKAGIYTLALNKSMNSKIRKFTAFLMLPSLTERGFAPSFYYTCASIMIIMLKQIYSMMLSLTMKLLYSSKH